MKAFYTLTALLITLLCSHSTMLAAEKINWGNTLYKDVTTGEFSAVFVVEDKLEARKHYLKFVAIYQDKIGVYMAKEITATPKGGKTSTPPWVPQGENLQSSMHTQFKDIGEKLLITKGNLMSIQENGTYFTMRLVFADVDIVYHCQLVYLGEKKK